MARQFEGYDLPLGVEDDTTNHDYYNSGVIIEPAIIPQQPIQPPDAVVIPTTTSSSTPSVTTLPSSAVKSLSIKTKMIIAGVAIVLVVGVGIYFIFKKL